MNFWEPSFFLHLERRHGTWFCSSCESKNGEGHLQALKDFELLLSLIISNKELREYLCIQSPFVASRLLRSMNLPSEGSNKGKKYFLNFLEKEK